MPRDVVRLLKLGIGMRVYDPRTGSDGLLILSNTLRSTTATRGNWHCTGRSRMALCRPYPR